MALPPPPPAKAPVTTIVTGIGNTDKGAGTGVPVPSRIVTIRDSTGRIISQGLSSGPTRGGVPFVQPKFVDPQTLVNVRSLQSQGFDNVQIQQVVERFTPQELSQRIAGQVAGQDVQASVLLSRISQKKLQEEYERGVKAPLEDYKSKEEAFLESAKRFEASYGGRGLTEQEYARALQEQKVLQQQQEELNQSFATLRLTEKVEQTRAKQTAIDRQQAQARQLAGQATVQEILKSGAGIKTPSSIISDTRSPLQRERELIGQTSLAKTPETIKIAQGATAITQDEYKRIGGEFSSQYELVGDDTKKIFDLKELQKEKEFVDQSIKQSASNFAVTPLDLLMFTPIGKPVSLAITKLGGFALKPLIKISSKATTTLLKPVLSTKIAKTISIKTKDFIQPTIRFPKDSVSKITQTGALSGKKIVLKGKGNLLYEEAGMLAKLKAQITRQPLKFTKKEVGFKFDVDAIKMFTELKKVGKPKLVKTGSPFELKGLIPEERFKSLVKQRLLETKVLKARTGFKTEGILEINFGKTKDFKIIQSFTEARTKQVRVGTVPVGTGTKSMSGTKFRLLSFGEEGIASGRVKAVINPLFKTTSSMGVKIEQLTGQLIKVKPDSIVTKVISKFKTTQGPVFKTKSLFVQGKTSGAFDFGKIKAVAKTKASKIKLSELSAVVETRKLLKAGANISDDLLLKFENKQLSLIKPKPFIKTVVGKPVDAKSKSLFKSILAKPVKEGKWAFKPQSNIKQLLLDSKKLVEKPTESLFKVQQADPAGLKIYKVIKGELRRVNRPAKPGVLDTKSKELFKFLSDDKAKSLFKIKRTEVKAVDLVRPVVTKKDKELFKYLSSEKTPSLLKLKSTEVKASDLVRNPIDKKSKELFKFLSDVYKEEGLKTQLTTTGQQIPLGIAKQKTGQKTVTDFLKLSTEKAITKPLIKSIKEQKGKQIIETTKKVIVKARPITNTSLLLIDDYEVEQVIPQEYASTRTGFIQPTTFNVRTNDLQVQKIGFMSNVKLKEPFKSTEIVKTMDLTKTSPLFKTSTMTMTIPREATQAITKQIVTPITKQQTRTLTRTLTKTATRTLIRTPTSVTPRFSVPTPPIPPIIVPLPKMSFGPVGFGFKKKGLLDVFDVEVRKKGKFVKVASALPRGLAKRVGIKVTGETIARTFRLTRIGAMVTKDVPLPKLDQYRLPKGRSSLKGPFTFVEKSKFAIDSPTEKRTLKEARRLKRVFNY